MYVNPLDPKAEAFYRKLPDAKSRKRQGVEGKDAADIPQGTKQIPSGAYEVVFTTRKSSKEPTTQGKLRRLRSVQTLPDTSRYLDAAITAGVDLDLAVAEALGREELGGSSLGHSSFVTLKRGNVFFTPRPYRELEKIAEQSAAKKGHSSIPRPETIEFKPGTMDLAKAVFNEGHEQERSRSAIKSGMRHVLTNGLTAHGRQTMDQRVDQLNVDLLLADGLPKTMHDVSRQAAEKVLSDSKRGKIIVHLEPTTDPENPFQGVITKVIKPKKV